MLNPNCSEAVFRFFTVDPEQIRAILQAYADEASSSFSVPPLKHPGEVEQIGFPACNHDAECFFEPDLKAFVLRIGNNDLESRHATEFVKSLGIVVEEAETSPDLDKKYARDCTCGIRFFDGYANRKVTLSRNPLLELNLAKQ
jgi:hypothetical protein